MTTKNIIRGKNLRTCDICGCEMDNITGIAGVNIILDRQWYDLRDAKTYDICIKHKKEVELFLKKLSDEEIKK